MRVVLWGTYDNGKPRVRILKRGLKDSGVEVVECHRDVWKGIEDKTQIKSLTRRIVKISNWIISYPYLIFRYLTLPKHDAVIIGYLGHLDVLIIWPFAKLRRIPVLWDAFLSLHNTVVDDRSLISSSHPLSKLLFAWEWLACRAADLVILDTRAHADYFTKSFNLPPEQTDALFVGAESELFPVATSFKDASLDHKITVLFYGQFSPLHGIETIIQSANICKDEQIDWIIIGKGQEESKIRMMLAHQDLPRLQWLPWVDYTELTQWIRDADVCLGIFGDTDKACRVIPNKVFQILMSGKPLITRDSAAIRELLTPDMEGIWLIPPADPYALASAIRKARKSAFDHPLHLKIREKIDPSTIGFQLTMIIKRVKRD